MSITDRPAVAGSRSSAISNLTIRLLTHYTGRGPTRARTYFNDDMVTIVLQDILTKAETALVDSGRTELVLANRKAFQELMGAELTAGIEEILQRKVVAFMSANHVEPDIAVETFLLEPRGEIDVSDGGTSG